VAFSEYHYKTIRLNASKNVNAANRSRHLMIYNAMNKERAKQRNSNVMNVAWASLIIEILVITKISTRKENVINVESVAKHSGIMQFLQTPPLAKTW
jgi:hypothetical protein